MRLTTRVAIKDNLWAIALWGAAIAFFFLVPIDGLWMAGLWLVSVLVIGLLLALVRGMRP